MSTESDLDHAKTAINVAKEAASKIHEWAEQAKLLAEGGKELSEIQVVLKGVTVFGKVSAIMGVAAGGMGMLIKIVGGPSPEEKIMSMIDDLSAKVGRILIHQDNIEARQKAHHDLVNAKDQIWPHLEFIKILMGHIEEIQTATEEDKAPLIKNLLLHYNNKDLIDDAVMQIADLLQHSDPDQNVLRATYIATYGDPKSICNVTASLLMAAVDASIAYGFVAKHLYQSDNTFGLLSTEAMGQKFQPQIDRISRESDKYISKCWSETEKNINNRLKKEEILEKLDVTDYQQASDKLCGQLSGSWYMYDWLVIVYAPWKGYKHHGVTGGDFRIERFRQKCLNDVQANIIIAWTPKGADGFFNSQLERINEFFLDNFSGILSKFGRPRLFPTGLINPQRVLDFRPNPSSQYEHYKGIDYYFRLSRSYELTSDTRAFLEAWPEAAPFPSLLWAGPADFGKSFTGDAVFLSIPLTTSPAVPKQLVNTVLENGKFLRGRFWDLYKSVWDVDPREYKHQYSYIVFRQGGPKGRNSKAEVAAETKRAKAFIRGTDLDL